MKKVKLSALIVAAMLSVTVLAGCGEETDQQNNADGGDTVVSSVQESSDESSSEESASVSDTEEQPSESDSSESDTENSTASNEESSDTQNSESSESSTEGKAESSEASKMESSEESDTPDSSEEESSEAEGYYFDDEQIVEDYHEAKVFTNNDEFNQLFKDNAIDKAYTEELQNTEGTTAEMRSIIQKYAEQWKVESTSAYDQLSALLEDNPDEKAKLEKSQSEWENGTQQMEESFYAEVQDGENGSLLLISADTAIMNYYKGRTAVLYEQIYELTGSFALSYS